MKHYRIEYNLTQDAWHIEEGFQNRQCPGWILIADGIRDIECLAAFSNYIDTHNNFIDAHREYDTIEKIEAAFWPFFDGWHRRYDALAIVRSVDYEYHLTDN